MRRGWLLVGMSACLAASLLFAAPGTVTTKDGQTYSGDVVETGDGVTVTVHNIATNIPQANVASIEYSGNIDQAYKARLAKLGPAPTVQDHLDLAKWLLDNQAFDLAFEEVAKAQQLEPNNADATALFETIRTNRHQYLQSHTAAAPGGLTTPAPAPAASPAADAPVPAPADAGTSGAAPTTAPVAAAPAAPAPLAPSPTHYLTDADINSLRQHEWRGPGSDGNVGVRLLNNVKKRFAATLQHPEDFNASNIEDQAWTILNKGSADMIKDVQLSKDPNSLLAFRQVQPWVMRLCADCHSTTKGSPGHLGLYPPDSDAASYTNFYILLTATSANNGGRPVVNRDRPEASLLLQYALPPKMADLHHPAATGFRPPVQSPDDVVYKKVLGWIRDSLNPISQDYQIKYTLPGTSGGSAPAPEATPATAPASK